MLKKASFKLVFDILYFLVVMNALATIIIILIEGFDVTLSNSIYQPQNTLSNYLYIGAINEIIFSIAFVIVVYHLRKAAKIFIISKEFKSFNMVNHTKRSGQFLVILGLNLIVKKMFLIYYFETTRHFFQANSVIYLLVIVLGLSFIRVSKMLKISIQAKQEQDLTI
ncbi:MAG: hypothetical protein ABR595_06400 [Psychroflexus sp.]